MIFRWIKDFFIGGIHLDKRSLIIFGNWLIICGGWFEDLLIYNNKLFGFLYGLYVPLFSWTWCLKSLQFQGWFVSSNNNTKRNRQRNIIWFNLPFSRAVSPKLEKGFSNYYVTTSYPPTSSTKYLIRTQWRWGPVALKT